MKTFLHKHRKSPYFYYLYKLENEKLFKEFIVVGFRFYVCWCSSKRRSLQTTTTKKTEIIIRKEEHYINQHQEKKFYFIFLYLYYFLLLFLFHLLILFFISTQIHYMSAINKENLYIYFFNTHTTENCDCRETLYTYFDRENIKHCQWNEIKKTNILQNVFFVIFFVCFIMLFPMSYQIR